MKKIIYFLGIFTLSTLIFTACGKNGNDALIAYWNFNEGKGEEILENVSKTTAHINYIFNQQNQEMLFKEASDPLWKEEGVDGGCLEFDGYSTYIEDENIVLPTDQITISTWVAPRAFEWGDGNLLSSIVSQGSKQAKRGVQFGYYRHGTWSLQLGVGDDLLSGWVEIWDNGHPLPLDVWSYVSATYDTKSATARLYLNGELINEEVFSEYVKKPIRVSDEIFTIGKTNQNNKVVGVFDVNVFSGMMDELKIYDAVMDGKKVKEQYDSYVSKNNGSHPKLDYETIKLDQSVYNGDINRPQFHAIPSGHWMNEPHAPFYYNGKYHLFFQSNPNGPFWHQINWGHWVSEDMIHWEQVKEAISPTAGDITPDGVWTGSATYDADGNPILFFTAGNDSKSPNQSIAIATPKDITDVNLIGWNIYNKIVVEQQQGQGDFGEFRDPFVWRDEESKKWYMLVGSGTNNKSGGTSLIYSSVDLYKWEYHGNFFESNYLKYPQLGEHWELPVLLPVSTPDGSVEKYIYIISPHGKGADVEVYYWLGQFDSENLRFIPDDDIPKLMDYGDGVFTGPSGFVDPKTGRSILFTIAQGIDVSSWEAYYSGWAHTTGMPVSLYLDQETFELRYEPIEEVHSARRNTLLELKNATLGEANKALESIGGDLLEIELEIKNIDATKYGISVRKHPNNAEYTKITYKENEKNLVLDRTISSMIKTGLGTRTGKLELTDNGTLKLHILLDRSLIEIYGGNQMSITSRIYPILRESRGLELMADGEVEIVNMKIFEMGSVYTENTVEGYYPQ